VISVCVVIVGAVTGVYALMALGMIGGVGAVAIASMRMRQDALDGAGLEDLDADSRMLLRPFGRLRTELASVVERHSGQTSVKVVGAEALREAGVIVEQARRLVEARAGLKKTLKGKSEAELGVRRLERQLEAAASDAERASLTSALEAHREEVAQYARLERAIVEAESRLRQAEAALRELKSRLEVGAASAASGALMEDELGDVVGRLRSLGKSFDEAEGMLQEQKR
jgi:hypothetical protein